MAGQVLDHRQAPFCGGTCQDCFSDGAECVNGNWYEGATCITGRKVRCCNNRW